ncbi:MAG TPA: metallophosphoesterase [Gemmataceae bacterium]|nr:metallophosphoesterase [Gemmataceae bacterium]
MKRILLVAVVIGLVVSALAFSGAQKTPSTKGDLQIEIENRNPWSSLRFNDAPETFHFVVVSDRTGGHRPRIFSQAIEQINLLQPAFVVSVGDLIEGYSKDPEAVAKQWKELQTYTHKLQMPFFYVPGNHDVSNPTQVDVWKQRFGKRHYHFLYKDVLFLAVNTDDPYEDKEGRISKEQVEYFQKVLAENTKVRWIFVCLHKPIWTQPNLAKSGWLEMEKLLAGRNYTVFAGHIHRYQKFVRQGMNYYQLATTGGGSRLRGLPYGEFDHFAWVTMKAGSAPTIANLKLDGILPENLKSAVTDEEGVVVYNRKPVHPVRGKVTFGGTPAARAQILFWLPDPKDKDGKKATRISDAWVEADGSYAMSTYAAFDGLPEGKYKVTVTLRDPYFLPDGTQGKNLLPPRYETHMTTPLVAEIKSGKNEIDFVLGK